MSKAARSDQLVRNFIAVGIEQEEAELREDIDLFTKLFRRKATILSELANQPGDQRRLLVDLLDHSSTRVRLNAATATLALAPIEAREVLASIQDSRLQPHSAEAGMCLWNLDRGIFKPT